MKISEICKELNISRQGLYWMLEHNDLQEHAKRKPSGRWMIDDTAIEYLKAIRKQSKSVLIVTEPTDPHADETISGMQIEINKLAIGLRKEQMKYEQGVYLANSIEEVAKESKGLDISTKRQLLRLVSAFRSETKDAVIKKRLKNDSKVLEIMGQNTLFEEQ